MAPTSAMRPLSESAGIRSAITSARETYLKLNFGPRYGTSALAVSSTGIVSGPILSHSRPEYPLPLPSDGFPNSTLGDPKRVLTTASESAS